MWTVVVIGRDKADRSRVAGCLEGLDRRLRLVTAGDAGRALPCLERAGVALAVVAEPGSPDRLLSAVRLLGERFPQLPVVAEVPRELPLVALQALGMGAADCLARPVAPWEWRTRCASLLEGQRRGRVIGWVLRRAALRARREPGDYAGSAELMAVLARANLFRDAATGRHERRTGRIARLIAEALGLPAGRCAMIEAGARLHDIGKLGIPDEILLKPGSFNARDRSVMREHPEIGHRILRAGSSPTLRESAEIALCHHERRDGSGYPRGLAGDDIPLAARIVAVADVLEAITGRREYRRDLALDEGLAHLKRRSGQEFDGECVDALRSREREVARVVGAV
jgi:two-component system response regulator RpfG